MGTPLERLATVDGRPMRVLQAMGGARPGGAETFFASLVLALNRVGLEQRVVIRENAACAPSLRAGGIVPNELPFGRWTDFTTARALEREVGTYKPDVVLTWMSRASAVFPSGDFLRLARLGGYYDIKNYRRCDHLICNTPDIVEHMVTQGWPRERAHDLPNFAAVTEAPPIARDRLDTPDDAVVLLALGRLHEAKAFDVLLKALAIETRPVLWLAGEGRLEDELRALAQSLGVAERVRFLGWRDDRGALFAAADICVLPSRVEPFGNVIPEAWACRRPVVTAASTGPAAMVRRDEDALLVPVDDAAALAAAIGRLIDEPDLRARLAEVGRRRYEAEFTEAACVERYLRLFGGLLEEHRVEAGAIP